MMLDTAEEHPAQKSRTRLIVVGLPFILLLGIIVASMITSATTGPLDDQIMALYAMEDGGAALIWRDNNLDGEWWVGRVDQNGHQLWRTHLKGTAQTIGPYNGLIVKNDVVAVRTIRGLDSSTATLAVSGFSVATGKTLWDTSLGLAGPDGSSADQHTGIGSQLSLIAGESTLFVTKERRDAAIVFAIDLHSGKIKSRSSPRVSVDGSPVVLADSLIVHALGYPSVVFSADGETSTQIDNHEGGCLADDEYVNLVWDHGTGKSWLVRYGQHGDLSRAPVTRPLIVDGVEWMRLTTCGSYGDELVLSVHAADAEHHDQALVLVVSKTGDLLHTIRLGREAHWSTDSFDEKYPASASIGGRLSRFVPIVDGGGYEQHVVMLDLEAGTIAWQGRGNLDSEGGALFHSDDNDWILITDRITRPVISHFDGRTGQLTAAVRTTTDVWLGTIEPTHLSAGGIWIYGQFWRAEAEQRPIARLDVATLTSRQAPAHGLEVVDATASVREDLGIP